MVIFDFVLTKGDCLSTHDCSQPWDIPPSKAVYIQRVIKTKIEGNYCRITWRVFPSCTSSLPQLQKASASEVCYRLNNKIESKGLAATEFRSYCPTRAAKKDLLKKERLIGQHTGLLRYLCLQRFRFPAGPVARNQRRTSFPPRLGISCALSIAYLQCSELLWCLPPSPIKEQMYSEDERGNNIKGLVFY